MADEPYATEGLPPAPAVSRKTQVMGGLVVDVFGLGELPADDEAPTTCLWLLHPRERTRHRMHDVARRAVDAWNQQNKQKQQKQQQQKRRRQRGLVALAFDLLDHGNQLVSAAANRAWADGNERHALDMAAVVARARGDMSRLMGLAGGCLGRRVDAHVALGWSLGGHAAWQAVFGEPRLDAAVVVGCADLLGEFWSADAARPPPLPPPGGQHAPPRPVAPTSSRRGRVG